MEILSPAGSPDVVRAAVLSGADALYLGASAFNARINANNFTDDELKETVKYCHERGVRVYATVNTLITDRETDKALDLAKYLTEIGIDAFIVQDLGLAMRLKKCSSVPLHASTQMSVHTLDGVNVLADLGFTRVVLARELPFEDISYITRHAPIETEVFVHGAFCMSYSGQCYMSSVIGGRSGNRGLCAQPCRLPYQNGYTLSLKDNCLLEYVDKLKEIGVASLKIEGRMKGAEYVAGVTDMYVRAKNGEPYSLEKKEYLAKIFSRQGFTDGYFTDNVGKDMFGVRKEKEETVRVKLPTEEFKRFPLDINVKNDGETVLISVTDGDFAAEESLPVQKAEKVATTETDIETCLSKLGGTSYYVKTFSCEIKPGSFIPVSLINNARRNILKSLTEMRLINNRTFTYRDGEKTSFEKSENTAVEGWFLSECSIPENAGKLDKIWLYAECFSHKNINGIADKYGEKLGIVLPPIFHDSEKHIIKKHLEKARSLGVKNALCGNIGQIPFCKELGFTVHGGYGLNIFNGQSVLGYESLGCESVTLSFELTMRQCEDLCDKKTGIIAYGRLPFMVMRNCVKGGNGHGCERKGRYEFLTDRMKKKFLLTCDFGCRNRLWNADKLYLADKNLPQFGFIRLLFTDETPTEAKEIISAYTEKSNYMPENITRGRYYQ